MNEGLEALERIINLLYHFPRGTTLEQDEQIDQDRKTIEKELKESDKIKARLTVVKMKLKAKREECCKNMEFTEEDDYVHEASKIMVDCIDWFQEMLKEVLL